MRKWFWGIFPYDENSFDGFRQKSDTNKRNFIYICLQQILWIFFFIRIGLINTQKIEIICLHSIAAALRFNRMCNVQPRKKHSHRTTHLSAMKWNWFYKFASQRCAFSCYKNIYLLHLNFHDNIQLCNQWISNSISFRWNRNAQGHVTSWFPIRKRYLCNFNVFIETIKPSFLLMILNVWSN